jgi:hypothetical protein
MYDDLYIYIYICLIRVLSCLEDLEHSNLFSTADSVFYPYWYTKGQKLYSMFFIHNSTFLNVTDNA